MDLSAKAQKLWKKIRQIEWKKFVKAIDPNDDPTAEPVSPFALLTLAIFAGISLSMYLRWRIQPQQDTGLHVAFAAVFADYGKAGSIYPAIYKPLDVLSANSFLYTVAGGLGKIINPVWAFRLTIGLGYHLGLPIANYYALRVFGRSAWGAVISVPFVYNLAYVYGFMSFLFAGPLAVLAVPLMYRLLVNPTRWRILAVAIVTTCLFLTHFHIYMWMGIILATMSIVAIVVASARLVLGRPTAKPWLIAAAALGAVTPSLLLTVRWMVRLNKPPAEDEYILATMKPAASLWPAFKAGVKLPSTSMEHIQAYLRLTISDGDHWFFICAFALAIACVGLSRLHKWKRPPVLEIVCAVSLLSYFVLPEDFASQQVIASRQIGFGLWFASAFFTPVPLRVSWLGRTTVITVMILITARMLSNWYVHLVKFQRDEARGFDQVMAAAPPQLKIHYVGIDPDSKYFTWHTFWHVDNWYMLEKRGQCNANAAYVGSMPIRYRKEAKPYHATHVLEARNNAWSGITDIWDNFDLVLVHKWRPSAKDLENANQYGVRLAKAGDWELWRSKRREGATP